MSTSDVKDSVRIWDGSSKAHICKEADSQLTIDTKHETAHLGNLYRRCYYWVDVADNASANLVIKNKSTAELHAIFDIAAEGKCRTFFYETPTLSLNGTEITPVNFNRVLGKTSSASAFIDPTVASYVGTLCGDVIFAGDKKSVLGGRTRDEYEWILAKDTTYMAKALNQSGGAADVLIAVEYYEVKK